MASIHTAKGATSATLAISDIDVSFPRHTVAISYFSDAIYSTPVLSGVTGTIAIEGLASGGQNYTAFNNSPINSAVAGSIASAASNITDLKVTPTSLSGAAFYQVTITSSQS